MALVTAVAVASTGFMKRYSPIFIRLYASFALVILVSVSILGLMVQRQIEQASLQDIRTNLSHQAYLLQEAFVPQKPTPLGQQQLQAKVNNLGLRIDARITLIGTNGVVLADSEVNPQQMDNHLSRPEIQAATQQGIGFAQRFSNTLNTRMLYVAVPSANTRTNTSVSTKANVSVSTGTDRVSDSTLGYLRVALSTELIEQEVSYLRRVIIIATGMSAILALFVGYWLAASFVRPLRQMTRIANNYVQGRYPMLIPSYRQDEIGDLAQSLNQLADISAQRFDNLATERDLLKTILTSMNEGVISVDQEGIIQHINITASQMLRCNRQEALGKTLADIDPSHALQEAWQQCQRQSSGYQKQIQLSGYAFARHYLLHAARLRESNAGGSILVLQDITEIQRIDSMRADFIANASHELKTPITAIRGFAETLIEERDIDHKMTHRFIRKIYSQSIRLSDLVSDLLALSRLETNDEAFEKKVVLSNLCKHIGNNLQAVAQTKEISLKLHYDKAEDTAFTVLGDERALSQLVTNLVDNAIKYTPPKGQVDVYLQRQEHTVSIIVQDTGIGIATIDQHRIFERFYRVDKAHSREVGGTGLGLAIVKHVVQSHKGRMQVISDKDNGARFEVYLPAAE